MNNYKIWSILAVMLLSGSCISQETLNADDPNSFIFGGDQKSITASISLQSIYLVDVESDPDNTIRFNVDGTAIEAGLPAMGAKSNGIETNETLWLNFSSRSVDGEKAIITVRTNQPVPDGIIISVALIAVSPGGFIDANEEKNPIILSEIAERIVDKIENGYTNDFIGNGFQIQYTVENNQALSLPPGFEIIYEIKQK